MNRKQRRAAKSGSYCKAQYYLASHYIRAGKHALNRLRRGTGKLAAIGIRTIWSDDWTVKIRSY